MFAKQGTLISDAKKKELHSLFNEAVMDYQVAATLQSGGQETAANQNIISPDVA